MARSINVGHQHALPSQSHDTRSPLRFTRSNWGISKVARRLARSKRKVEKRGVPFKMTVIFDLERPLPFSSGWSTNIKPSADEVATVTQKVEGLFEKRGIHVDSLQLAQSDVDDSYLGVFGKYITVVVVS